MIHTGDCIEVMAGMQADSVDAVVTDPPYGIGFMGKAWDELSESFGRNTAEKLWDSRGRTMGTAKHDPDATTPHGRSTTNTGYPSPNPRCGTCGRVINGRETPNTRFKVCHCPTPNYIPTENRQAKRSQEWHRQWGEAAFRVTRPGGYLLAFGGTRTHHRLVCGLEDAGWIIRDELTWVYASGFPKGKANLKPAHEPIVLARKPGPLRPLNIEETRIPGAQPYAYPNGPQGNTFSVGAGPDGTRQEAVESNPSGRWPSNLLLSDPELFDEPNPYVVGSGAVTTDGVAVRHRSGGNTFGGDSPKPPMDDMSYGDSGGYSRFFIVPKSSRSDREPTVRGTLEPGMVGGRSRADGRQWDIPGSTLDNNKPKRENTHPTCKPVDLMRHLIRLVTPSGGTVLDPFAGSGSTLIAAELEGFPWIGIEQDASYVAIAEARLNGTQRGLGLDVGAPTTRGTIGMHSPVARQQRNAERIYKFFESGDEEPVA